MWAPTLIRKRSQFDNPALGSRPGPPSLCAPFVTEIMAAVEAGLSAKRIHQDLRERGFWRVLQLGQIVHPATDDHARAPVVSSLRCVGHIAGSKAIIVMLGQEGTRADAYLLLTSQPISSTR